MLIRCRHCSTPFTLTPETLHAALDQLEERGWKHYNAYCPRCGRPNVVPRDQLMRAAPDWSPDGTVQSSRPAVVSTPAAQPAAPKPERQAAVPKPAAKPAKKAAKPAAKKAAKPAKKTAAKKPAAKKAAKPAKKAAPKKPAKKAAKKKKK